MWSLNQGKDIGVSETIGEVSTRLITLPGDVLFLPGRSELSLEGSDVFNKIFYDETGQVLNFQDNGLTKRLLVIHGHTDGDGEKDANFQLGFQRAYAAYSEIKSFTPEIADHAIILLSQSASGFLAGGDRIHTFRDRQRCTAKGLPHRAPDTPAPVLVPCHRRSTPAAGRWAACPKA